MSKTLGYAERELDILVKTVDKPVIRDFIPEILKLVDKFSNSGQSGGSAPMVASALSQAIKHLCLQEPICDITGHDDEWNDVAGHRNKKVYQNNRLSSIFKEGKDGEPYYLNAIVFRGDITGTFTGNGSVSLKDGSIIKSRQFVKLPFKPKTFYIDVIETEWADKEEKIKKQGGGWWTSIVKDEKQLEEVFKYYKK